MFSVVSLLALYAIQRLQYYLPLNPQEFSGVNPDLAFNTAVSFTSNTNWQAYSGESDDELLHADGGPCISQLRVCRDGHRAGNRLHSRRRAARVENNRQLLG